MKVTYTVPVRDGVNLSVPAGTGPAAFGGAAVGWKVSADKRWCCRPLFIHMELICPG
jgi:hypothetical protein